MNGYLLDTSICVYLFRGNRDVMQRLNRIGFEHCNSIDVYAKEKVRLKKAGMPIEDFDLLIGCAAKAAKLTMVTNNIKHFSHIEGLVIEDWIQ